MALTMPEHCPSKATQGETRLFELLRGKLPDRFTIWYEPKVDDRFPDFTLIAPDFAFVAIDTG